MKLFKTNNIEIVKVCQEFFGFQLPSVQIAKRITKFEIQFQERSRLIKSCNNSNTSNLIGRYC